jgi:outer membrane protein assembly factor BamB
MKPWLLVALLPFSSGAARPADWPQWRGPNRDGISTETISPNWPAGGPKLRWKASVGTGFSSLAISERKIFTMGNSNEQEIVWCLDAANGSVEWKHVYPAALNPQYYEGGPGATPTFDSGKVFTIGKWGNVFCLDTKTGRVEWALDLRREGFHTNRWGFAGSPLVWHDLLILNAGSAGTALDRRTGRVVWSNGTNSAGYASPVLTHWQGKDIALIFAAKHLVALDPATGKELWRHPWETGWDTNNTDPIARDDKIFLSSFTHGCALLTPGEGAPQVVYENKALFNNLSPGVLIGDYLYAFSGEAKKDTDFRCIHWPSGELKWSVKDPAFGSVMAIRENLLILTEKGELMLAKPGPTGLQPLARAQILGGLCWTPPSFANGRIYARNAAGNVVCVDIEAGK